MNRKLASEGQVVMKKVYGEGKGTYVLLDLKADSATPVREHDLEKMALKMGVIDEWE